MKRIAILVVAMALGIPYAQSFAAACPMEKGRRAEEQASTIPSWTALHASFKEYGECDDGAIGEGFSDSVVRLLINDWAHVGSLQGMIDQDKDFGRFVLKHIDELMSPSEFTRIGELARHSCPAEAQRFCRAVESRMEDLGKTVKKQPES